MPQAREVARRVFAKEFGASNLLFKESDDQYSPQYVLTPTGAKCNRPLNKGVCVDHGKQEGEYDLRVKAVLDDGRTAQDIILNQEMTFKVTGIDVKIAKKMAMDAVDPAIVLDEIKRIMLGKYFTVNGRMMGGRYLLTNSMTRTSRDIAVDQVLKNVGAI